MCFGPKIMSNDQAVILLDDIAIIFHFDESRLSVLMCYLFDPLINNSYVRNYCKFHLSLMTGTCTDWCLLSYKLVVSGLFKTNDWLRNDHMFIEIKEYIHY